MREKLRIGVLAAPGGSVEGWEAYILSQLAADAALEFTAVIEHQEAAGAASGFGKKLRKRWRRIPHALAQRVVEGMDGWVARSAYRSIGKFEVDQRYPISEMLPNVPTLSVVAVESQSGLVQRFNQESLEKVRACELDLLLRFGFKILRGEILSAARFGVLSYHHADNRNNRGGPCGFWEVYYDSEQTGATLQVLTEELDGGIAVRRALYPTHRLSWNGNRRRLRATSTWLMIDAVRELARERRWTPVVDCRPVRAYSYPLYVQPDFVRSLAFAGKLLGRFLAHAASRLLNVRQWRILYRVGATPCSGEPSSPPTNLVLWKLKQLVPPRGRFFADPFLHWHQGKLYLFVEDYRRSTGKAVISWFEWAESDWKYGGVALECPYHLSYPFLFEHDERIYMIPESCESGRIELWEAEAFPQQWKLARVLLDDIVAVDSTLLLRDGTYYLFTNVDRAGIGDPGTELHIYFTDDLLQGEWQAHPRNPVLQDCSVARNAGGFFRDQQGRLIRAAQANGSDYGQGLVFREVYNLSQREYQERTLETVLPRWDPNLFGMHHVQFAQGSVVLDALYAVSRF